MGLQGKEHAYTLISGTQLLYSLELVGKEVDTGKLVAMVIEGAM